MNRAMIFPIKPKWVEQIFDGSKKFEFRGKLPKRLKQNMKIYIYETLGRKHIIKEMGYITSTTHDGSGMIVGSFVVGEIYEIINPSKLMPVLVKKGVHINYVPSETYYSLEAKTNGKHIEQGYTDQKYGFEITNVIKYDRFEDKKGFGTKQWIDLCEFNRKGYNKCGGCNYYSDNLESGCNTLETHCSNPTSPIPKEDFINWNKMIVAKKEFEDDCEIVCGYCVYTNFGERENKITQFGSCEGVYCDEAFDHYLESTCNIKSPPQAPLYVVEREGPR